MSEEEPRGRSTLHRLSTILDKRVQAFPTEYHGVPMRSKLEASFARHLDSIGVTWEYEPRPFFDADGAGYLPDFRCGDRYIEVKPTLLEVPLAQKRMESIWRAEPRAVLVVACAEACVFYACTLGEGWSSWVERWQH